jgi:hypothetical protein
MAMERAGGNYEAQRIAAEATFLARLPDSRVGQHGQQVTYALPSFTETAETIQALAARGGKDAEIAARLMKELLRAEFHARGIAVSYR